MLLKIKKLKVQLCTLAVVSYGFSPEDSAWGRAEEAEDTSAPVLTQGRGWQRQLRPSSFAAFFFVASACTEVSNLSVDEGECAPLVCSSHFQELPLI